MCLLVVTAGNSGGEYVPYFIVTSMSSKWILSMILQAATSDCVLLCAVDYFSHF